MGVPFVRLGRMMNFAGKTQDMPRNFAARSLNFYSLIKT
jgi:hypothetical protein